MTFDMEDSQTIRVHHL